MARLVLQDWPGTGLLGFESQGFLDAWAPVFCFAMIFANSDALHRLPPRLGWYSPRWLSRILPAISFAHD